MNTRQHQLLLADDDADDCLFFKDVLEELAINASLQTVSDGVELMHYLSHADSSLPQVLFLDLNMPRKDGVECLTEIRNNERLQQLTVIIFSTSLNMEVASMLYETGASYYIQKPGEFSRLKEVIGKVLARISETNSQQPAWADFIIE